MSLFDFTRRSADEASRAFSGLLSGPLNPGIYVRPGEVSDAPVGDVGQMRRPDVITQKPSLLEGIGKYLTSRDGMMALGAGLKSLSGEEGAGMQVAQLRRQMQADEERAAEKAQLKQERSKKNAAFRAAYVNGKFDPQAYLAALGDAGDASEAYKLAADMAPQGGISDGVAYTRDPFSGQVTWGEARPVTAEEQAQIEARRAQIANAQQRLELEQRRYEEAVRHNRAGEATAASNAARGWAAHLARLKAGGYGTPGVGAAAVPDDDVEIDQ